MRYLIRSLKYLVYFAVIFFLIVGIVYLFSAQKMAGLSFVDLFKEGSLPMIALFFVVVAALYPKLSFYKKELYLDGDFTKYATMVDEVMKGLRPPYPDVRRPRHLRDRRQPRQGGRLPQRPAPHPERHQLSRPARK